MKKIFLTTFLLALTLFSQTNLEYLNEKRSSVGLINLSENSYLDQSSQNHTDYVKTNIYSYGYEGHYETSSRFGFTGISPWDRAYFVGYKSRASENMTVGYKNYDLSIDGLFTAIYHRFGFLNFTNNEIGMGESINTENGIEYPLYTHVYNMGNSHLNTLCEGTSYSGYSRYIYSVCSDSSFKIESSLYNQAINNNINLNPDIVTWPYENQKNFQPAFFEESPDPLPTCSVTGNPISIQFNETTAQ